MLVPRDVALGMEEGLEALVPLGVSLVLEEGEECALGCAFLVALRVGRLLTTREKPSSSAGFGPISSAGAGATNKALQLTYSSSAGATRATTTSISSSVGKNPRYY